MGRVDQQIKDNYNSLSHENERLKKEAQWQAERLEKNAKLDLQDMKKEAEDAGHTGWDTVKEGAKSVQDYIASGIDSVKHTFADPEETAINDLKQNVNEKLDDAEKEGAGILGGISNFFRGTTEEAKAEADRLASDAYKKGDQLVGDVHKSGERWASDTQKDIKNLKKDGSKITEELKKDTAAFADETKKLANDLKHKAVDTYDDLSTDAIKKATTLKKKAGETIDESADAIEHQYNLFKRDFNHMNKRNGAIWASVGLVGGSAASSFFFPTASPMAKFTLIAGLASLGGYYGLQQPHNKIIDNAFHKAELKKEEIKKKL